MGAGDKTGKSAPAQNEQQEQLEKNKVAENEKSKIEVANASQEREVETNTREPKNDGTSSQKQTELRENESSMEEAKQNGETEPAEVAAAEMTTAGTSKGAKRDDASKGWGPSPRLLDDCCQEMNIETVMVTPSRYILNKRKPVLKMEGWIDSIVMVQIVVIFFQSEARGA